MTKIYSYFDRPRRNAWESYPAPDTPVLQGAALECDINRVVVRLKQGLDPGVPLNNGRYSDNTAVIDMKSNLDIIKSHQSDFEELDPAVRQKYRTPLEFYEAQQKALVERARTSVSLDVTGPTDSKLAVSTKKGAKTYETETDAASSRKKSVQTSDGDSSEE
nr:MAG: internal scaffolding protein [Microvirus sp.]